MAEEPKKAAGAPAKLELSKEIKLPTIALAADARQDGEVLYAACFDGFIYEVKSESGEKRILAKHESYASGVRYLPKAKMLISAGYDGQIFWIDPEKAEVIRKVKAHKFWSWQMDVSPDEKFVASSTGQYLAGGYKYEPAPEREPSVKIYDVQNGELMWEFSHVPPVQAVAFSPDSKLVAAGNMMGEVRVWDLTTGKMVNSWTTPDLTSWGIIKSHHYIGGVFDLTFTPAGNEILVCGMGPMRDPMAGNGAQTWQRFTWKDGKKTGQVKEDERGNGLMETLRFNQDGSFLVGGRLAQGKWNVAFFDNQGALVYSIDTKNRITDSVFIKQGKELLLAGGGGQGNKKDGKYPEFGSLKLYKLSS